MPHTKKRVSIKEIFYVVLVMTVTASILSPVIATTKGSSAVSNCQANLKKIGSSLKMYLSDWDETYPTNRLLTGNLTASIRLSTVGTNPATGKPYNFKYGITWVEGLYNYMEAIVAMGDTSSVWKCPAALIAQAGETQAIQDSAEVTYVFNFNLLEKPESVVRDRSKMMIVRETDRLVASNCCAVPLASGVMFSGATAPTITIDTQLQASFHMRPDACIKKVSGAVAADPTVKIHGAGSNILFTDGHVKLYNASQYFRTTSGVTSNASPRFNWDATDSAFYNATSSTTNPAAPVTVQKAIQITP